jgi:hypothetical protein
MDRRGFIRRLVSLVAGARIAPAVAMAQPEPLLLKHWRELDESITSGMRTNLPPVTWRELERGSWPKP